MRISSFARGIVCVFLVGMFPSCVSTGALGLIGSAAIVAVGEAETNERIRNMYVVDGRMTLVQAEETVGVVYDKFGIAITERTADERTVLLSGETPGRDPVWVRVSELDRGFVRFEVMPGSVGIMNEIHGAVQGATRPTSPVNVAGTQ